MFTNKKIHMIGIGGVSMSGIADILLSYNCEITGYDVKESELTKKLASKGIKISYEINLKNIENADIVIYTAAIKDDNEELAYAKKLNKELYERSVFFGLMMKNYKNVLCISGTHGKSTTSGMVSSIFMEAKLNPTIQIGAILPLIGGNDHVGDKEYFIAEACEYVDSFLDFFPTAEIILNIDNDHLDYFGNLDNIIKSFNRYTKLLPDNGILVINADDENTLIATKDSKKKITYGIENSANYMAKNIDFDENGHARYDLYINNEMKINVSLGVSGIHNVYNSLAAIALSHQYILDLEIITKALSNYHGVGRRFELLGTFNNCPVYDDYAHHPSEIKTTYESVKKTKHKENWAIFQPHTYSRTKDHLNEFGEVLAKFDHVIIAEIYAAREENIYNVSGQDIVNLIRKNGNEKAIYIESFEKIEEYIKENVQENDLIITIGAGPVNEVAKALVK
ncbi:MAG: UDP-N-acetylmuramate--L-alanine ligase [Firmicutes bacterium]|nr:UDP-N-acetylmuramate--L-alanine ligase [Bacillota bacterium]